MASATTAKTEPWKGYEPRIHHQQCYLDHLSSTPLSEHIENIKSIFTSLKDIQASCAPTIRLHFFAEMDISSGSEEGSNTMTSELVTLFSPTVSLESPARSNAILPIAESLSVFQGLSTPVQPYSTTESNVSNPREAYSHTEGECTSADNSDYGCVIPSSIPMTFPTWFPCKETIVDFETDSLNINPVTLGIFQPLSVEDTKTIYTSLFLSANHRAHSMPIYTNCGTQFQSLVYSMFTPPWLKRRLSCGSDSVLLDEEFLADVRIPRSDQEVRHLLFLLAAFYDYEVAFARPALNYMITDKSFLPARKRPQASVDPDTNKRLRTS